MEASVSPTWSIVSFVRDTPVNIRLFVSYHLGIGAADIQLFFDNPDDPNIEMLAHLDRVTTYRCDDAFWQNVTGQPRFMQYDIRQNTASTIGYEEAQADWVLHLDVNEFLHGPEGNPIACLVGVPDEKMAVRIRPAERVFVADDQANFFRLPMGRRNVKRVHGDFAGSVIWQQGFFGHLEGKLFVRGGLDDVSLTSHWAQWDDGTELNFVDVPATPEQCLLHNNADDLDTWLSKLEFYLESASFPRRLQRILLGLIDAEDAMGLQKVHQNLFSLTPTQQAEMESIGALFELEPRLDRFMAEYFPDYV